MTGVSNINQSADVLPFIGLTFTTDHCSQKLQPEVTVKFAFDTVYGGEEYDFGTGLAFISHRENCKWIAGGVSPAFRVVMEPVSRKAMPSILKKAGSNKDKKKMLMSLAIRKKVV